MGEVHSGLKQTDRDQTGNAKKNHAKENRSWNNEKRTIIDGRAVDRSKKRKQRIRSWNVC